MPPKKTYFLVSVNNPARDVTAGRVFDIPTSRQAAELIVDGTHVFASPEDIERWQEIQDRQAHELVEAEYARKQQFALPREMQDVMRVAAESLRARNQEPPPAKQRKEQEK